MELHQDTGEDAGAAIGRPEEEEARNTLSAEIAADAEEDAWVSRDTLWCEWAT